MSIALYDSCNAPGALSTTARNALVITHTMGPDGALHALSRYGDDCWDFRPFFPHAARGQTEKMIEWTKAPTAWVEALKDTVGTFMRVKRPGGVALDPSTLPKRFITLNAFAKWCSARGIDAFSKVTPFALAQYIQKLRDDGLFDRSLSSHTAILRRVYDMRGHLLDSFSPATAYELSNQKLGALWEPDADLARRTDVLPVPEAAALFACALALVERAEKILDLRDHLDQLWDASRETRTRNAWGDDVKKPAVRGFGFSGVIEFESTLADIRTACYIVLAQATGCRVHELGDAKVGCVFEEIVDGKPYYWLKSSTRKIGDGPTRWLAPQVAVVAARVLERQSLPLRRQLAERLTKLELAYASAVGEADRATLAMEVTEIKRNVDRLFLSAGPKGMISSTDTKSHNKQLNAFAKRMKLELALPLHTHRFRRTYAVILVRLNKGVRVDMVALRDHFKHASLLMTEWYTSLSEADKELLDVIDEEMDFFDGGLVEHWLSPSTPLAGGFGARIKAYPGRHHKPIVFKSKKEFVEAIQDGLSIRATGHSWCLADGDGCGGQGLFEATRCTDCGHSVIDASHAPVWQGIREQQRELLALDDIGPGGQERARRAAAKAEKVLCELLGLEFLET